MCLPLRFIYPLDDALFPLINMRESLRCLSMTHKTPTRLRLGVLVQEGRVKQRAGRIGGRRDSHIDVSQSIGRLGLIGTIVFPFIGVAL